MAQTFSVEAISSAYFVANVTLAGIMVHAQLTRRVYPGFSEWMASQLAVAGGVVLMAAGSVLPLWIPHLIGNALLMVAQVLVLTGSMRFFGWPLQRRWPWWVCFGIAVAALAWVVATGGAAAQRSLVFSIFTALATGGLVRALLRRQETRRDPAVLPLLAAGVLVTTFFSARAVLLMYLGFDAVEWNLRLFIAAFYIGIAYSTLLVFGFLQLVQARTEGELQAAQARAEEVANVDSLTGVWNRRRFETEAQREIAKATRHGQPLSLIAFDIDHFKSINDLHGHQTGDDVLREVCAFVQARLRIADALTRWGGDEFVVLTPMTTAAGAEALARSLCHALGSRRFEIGRITLSTGVAQHRPGESLEDWLARADRGIYLAKDRGRDQVANEGDVV